MSDSIVDRILDENDNSPIIVKDQNGNDVSMEQIAVIPYNGEIYSIMAPTELIDKGDPDIAIVFKVEGNKIKSVEDNNLIDVIFELYDRLYEESQNN